MPPLYTVHETKKNKEHRMQNIKLSELVKNHPDATIFLNERHIDYCCGGDHFLY